MRSISRTAKQSVPSSRMQSNDTACRFAPGGSQASLFRNLASHVVREKSDDPAPLVEIIDHRILAGAVSSDYTENSFRHASPWKFFVSRSAVFTPL
jgi:hypothetical protein